MSTILDALRKLQRERDDDARGDLQRAVAHTYSMRPRRRVGRWLALLVLVAGGTAAWWFVPRERVRELASALPLPAWLDGATAPEKPAPRATARRPLLPSAPKARPSLPPPTAPLETPPPIPSAPPSPAPPPPVVAQTQAPLAPTTPPAAPPAAAVTVAQASAPSAPAAAAPPPEPTPAAAPTPAPVPPTPAPAAPARPAAAKPAPARAAPPADAAARERERAREEVKKLVAEKSRAEGEPTRAASAPPASRTPDGDAGDFPDVRVESVRWHPDAERRVARIDLAQVGPLDVHEGDIVSGVLVVRIDPGALELQLGSARRRVTLGP